MYTFGRGSYGCLGHGNSEDKLEPCLVQALKDHTIVDVALGTSDAHTLCVTDVGLVFAFGDGDYGVSSIRFINYKVIANSSNCLLFTFSLHFSP